MSDRHELVLLPRVWRRQIPELVRRSQTGLAYLTRNFNPSARQWVASDLRPLSSGTRGADFGPLEDLLVMKVVPAVTPDSVGHLLSGFVPRTNQKLIGLTLGNGAAAGQWLGQVWERGTRRPLHTLRLIGPGMPVATTAPEPQGVPDDDPIDGRWSRTRGALGNEVWQKVRSSRVAVVGAGRNGSIAAMTFAMLGVGRIVVIDDDRDELHNLDATVGAIPAGLGEYKATNRCELIRSIRPTGIEARSVCHSLMDRGVQDELSEVDLIVTCVDRDAPRLAAAMIARRGKLHLDIGTGVFRNGARSRLGGDIRLLFPGESCILCLGGLRNLKEARYEVVAPPGSSRRGRRRSWFEQRAGSLVTVNQVAVNLGVQLWLDLLAGRVAESRWCRLEWSDWGEPHVEMIAAPASTQCALCRG